MSTIWDDSRSNPRPTVVRFPLKAWARNAVAAYRARQVPEPETRVLVTPPVQSPDERGQGDSTNARMHRRIISR